MTPFTTVRPRGYALMVLDATRMVAPTTLVNVVGALGLAIADGELFSSASRNPGGIYKIAIDGGAPATLASNLNYPYGVAVDANSVYWASSEGTQKQGTIKRVGRNGGSVTVLATGQGFPSAVALDDTSVYWINRYGDVMKRTPK